MRRWFVPLTLVGVGIVLLSGWGRRTVRSLRASFGDDGQRRGANGDLLHELAGIQAQLDVIARSLDVVPQAGH
jgi:hypothetical protein